MSSHMEEIDFLFAGWHWDENRAKLRGLLSNGKLSAEERNYVLQKAHAFSPSEHLQDFTEIMKLVHSSYATVNGVDKDQDVRKQLLISWGWPSEKYPDGTKVLLDNWDKLTLKLKGQKRDIFSVLLPIFQEIGLITEKKISTILALSALVFTHNYHNNIRDIDALHRLGGVTQQNITYFVKLMYEHGPMYSIDLIVLHNLGLLTDDFKKLATYLLSLERNVSSNPDVLRLDMIRLLAVEVLPMLQHLGFLIPQNQDLLINLLKLDIKIVRSRYTTTKSQLRVNKSRPWVIVRNAIPILVENTRFTHKNHKLILEFIEFLFFRGLIDVFIDELLPYLVQKSLLRTDIIKLITNIIRSSEEHFETGNDPFRDNKTVFWKNFIPKLEQKGYFAKEMVTILITIMELSHMPDWILEDVLFELSFERKSKKEHLKFILSIFQKHKHSMYFTFLIWTKIYYYVHKQLRTAKEFERFLNYNFQLIEHVKGTEQEIYFCLEEIIQTFGVEAFPKLLIPIAKVQRVGSFLCYRTINDMISFNIRSIMSDADIELLLAIQKIRGLKTNDFYNSILYQGINRSLIAAPIAQDKDIILSFLAQSSVDIIEVYEEFKILYASDHPEKHVHIKELMGKINKIRYEIYTGKLTEKYTQNMLIGVMCHIFSPEISIPRDMYDKTYNERDDRHHDIPQELHQLMNVKVRISTGSYRLKSGAKFNDKAWKNLIQVVEEVNKEKHAESQNSARLGLALLQAYQQKKLRNNREILKEIYKFWKFHDHHTLPPFNTDHETLMKYKEFIGDRLKNDIISTCLQHAHQDHGEQFNQLISSIEQTQDNSGLAKTIYGIIQSNLSDEQKKDRINHILEQNNHARIREIPSAKNWQDINTWLSNQNTDTMSKNTVNNIFLDLIGEDYRSMQQEMNKFEHEQSLKDKFGKSYIFILSKMKLHSCAMYNFGVCVAPDNQLWNSPDFWQMIIFDNEHNACGGVIYRTIEEQGKKYLIVSIQPNSVILGRTSPHNIYNKIVQHANLIKKRLGYAAVLIPTESSIHSNRGSIQEEIKKCKYPTITLQQDYDFSYEPYAYTYRKFYLVP